MKAVPAYLLLLLALIVLFTQCEKEPYPVNFPDNAFLIALISVGVDTNGDGIISVPEAEAIDTLDIHGRLIKSLEGIGAFVNLVYLECHNNELTRLDLSMNTKLEELYCHTNQIISLDVSKCIPLSILDCSRNQLTSMDLSNNTVLTELNCDSNQLSSLYISNCIQLVRFLCTGNLLSNLDISKNSALDLLLCESNQLTSLDISKNTSLTDIYLDDMPTLNEVCVWTTPFPPDGVWVRSGNSPNINFTTECSK